MPIKWKPRFKPQSILTRISNVRTKNPNGSGSSFSGFDLHTLLPTLHSMLDFPKASRDLDHASLIWKAVASDPEALTPQSFLKELNKQLSDLLSMREQTYKILSTISIDTRFPISAVTINDVKIEFFNKEFPRKYVSARENQTENNTIKIEHEPNRYTHLVATTKGKTPAAAYARASRSIDLYRGIWCLYCNSEMEIIGRSWTPINKIGLGSIHTVHTIAGKIADPGTFWFEPPRIEKLQAFHSHEIERVHKRVQTTLRRLSQCHYQADLTDALILYVRALDEFNQTTAFVRLWGALERLASPYRGDYDAIVRRTSFIWHDVDFAQQTLEHLREYRNLATHEGVESPSAKDFCFQLQTFFRELIFFHIRNNGKLRTLEEANKFLDLPPNLSDLTEIAKRVAIAKRFRQVVPPET